VLSAALNLFLEQGYAGTTVEQIAARAGVSKPTVFSSVGNKQTVFRTVRDVAMAGDYAPVAVVDRPDSQRMVREPDPYIAAAHLAAHVTGVVSRYAQLDEVLRQAAASGEPELRDLWKTAEGQRLTGATYYVDALMDKGALRDGMDRETAIDVLWVLMAPHLYHQLVTDRGWTKEKYGDWLGGAISLHLLPPRRATARRPR